MKKCDLVMKGGITSGIVYPGAVCELAKEYEFASIGGTSAGAIAAAITAAAELRRQNGSDAGFEELAKLPGWLAENSRLLSLFQPDEETAPIFDVVVTWIETRGTTFAKARATLAALARNFNRYGGMVLAIGALFAILGAFGAWPVVFFIALASAVGFVIASAIEAIAAIVRVLPRHGFGLCSGMGSNALTQWLDVKISDVAGLDRPLTFGDLAQHGVNLEMMTTNLTHGRPYRLPLESKQFLFSEREMRGLFPKRVVDWMIEHSARVVAIDDDTLYALPKKEHLPVVVATRMSLSFPLLLSAVPLWSVDFGASPIGGHERCWFSDGGITSNFPVHFFDKPLPRWPTFAFNLAERTPRYHKVGQTTYVPRSNHAGIQEWWSPFDTLFGFLGAIVNTMQNWRDNMLLHLPGQRDRIAHVLLAPDEGGIHLTMDRDTILSVAARGAEAASTLRAHFGATPPANVTLTWSNHKWVRFLAFMPALEEALESWSAAFPDRTAPPSFEDLLTGAAALPSYKVSAPQRASMHAASLAFIQHIQQNFGSRPFRRPPKRPKPEPELRPMPQE